ncbi:hypothetical protein EKO27_g4974 [Xylaria grammica]|uniref:Mitochondrial outer membrane transport complex Sam37/metaxin N-terminal domain-containing protein n=1 Tax=Xylaria grammica TaxID=363999 RepID=A0A439D6V1_9PEZI|nr:hypothetical protein EKO27_g4974 [Xylaria grammica]
MSFQLHVWGPAFGLESIDAECLAAIAAFRHIFHRDDWSLIASNDTSLNPDPGGRSPGILFVPQHPRIWFSSVITVRVTQCLGGAHKTGIFGAPTIPLTWTIPTAIRAAAVEKADYLGMGFLAAEAEADEAAAKSGAETTSTGFLRLRQQLGPRKSLQPEQTAAIRFGQLADDFFTTLDDLRGSRRYLLGTPSPSSLDFLTYGYLALMRVQTPYPILARSLRAKSRPTMQFLQMMESESQEYVLPRQESSPRGLPRTMCVFADGAIESIAGAGESWRRWRRGGIKSDEGEEVQDSGSTLAAVGSAVVGLAVVGAAVFLRGLSPFGASTHRFEAPKQETGLYRFGEVGAMLDVLPIFE